MITALALTGAAFALLPCLLFLRNLRLYTPPPAPTGPLPPVSVLIPARNEERVIERCLRSMLASRDVEFEVIVLDDGSTDRTGGIVRALAARDARVRLETGAALPEGWSGKQHACWTLARHARHGLLIFADADLWVEPDALARIAAFMERTGVALASGVPRQVTGTFSERLLIPLIQFVLLGFLPLDRMRRTRDPGASAGCGQLFVARRADYVACGGHYAIRATLHDGTKLPRAFRAAGLATDLFDATPIVTCRMYFNDADVWRGLGRSAHEAMGAPKIIGPATFVLLAGQVLPVALLLAGAGGAPLSPLAWAAALLGTAASFLPRFIAAARFHQSWLGALLHPLGILALLAINGWACLRSLRGRPAEWKGRLYTAPGSA